MVIGRFKGLLPKPPAPAEQLAIYEKLLAQPMHVSNAELHQIIHMQLSVKGRKGRNKGKGDRHRFYIRSWVFMAQELVSLTRVMKDAGHSFRELEEWDFVSSIAKSQVLTLRYIGTAKGCRSPHEPGCSKRSTNL
jgi:hypothetical protein